MNYQHTLSQTGPTIRHTDNSHAWRFSQMQTGQITYFYDARMHTKTIHMHPVARAVQIYLTHAHTHTHTSTYTHMSCCWHTHLHASMHTDMYTYTATSTVNVLDDCDKSWAIISGSHAHVAYSVCPNGQGRAPTDHSLEWSVPGTHWPFQRMVSCHIRSYQYKVQSYIDKTHVAKTMKLRQLFKTRSYNHNTKWHKHTSVIVLLF